MATVNAYNGYGINMLNWDLSVEASHSVAHWINSDLYINGTLYHSAYSIEVNINGNFYWDIFAGNFSTNVYDAVTGGIVSGYYEYNWNGSSWVLANSTTGFSYSAVSFYNAGFSGSQSDTTWIHVSILSGNDLINGSPAMMFYMVD